MMTEPLELSPAGWTRTVLGDVTQMVLKIDPSEEPGKEFLYLDISSVDNAAKKIVAPKRYLAQDAPSRARQLVRPGDTLFSTVRTYLRNIAMVTEAYDGQVASTGFCVIRPAPPVDSRFIFLLVQTDAFVDALTRLQRGTSYPAVRDSDVLAQEVPLPPLPEQQRIVAKIEELFTRLDAGVESLERVQALLERYRQAVLRDAFEGRLTAAWREAHRDELEPASVLLERIRREREDAEERRGRRGQRLVGPPLDTSSLPVLPEGWTWAPVVQLGMAGEQAVLTGPFGTTLGRSDFVDAGTPVLTIGCLTDAGINLSMAKFILQNKASRLEKYRLQPGDLLFSRMASVGRAGCVDDALGGALFNYHIMRLRLDPAVLNPQYFLAYVRGMPAVRDYIRETNHGATRDGINTEQLLNMPVALPPIAEQRALVSELERFFSLADALGQAVYQSMERAKRLRQSILHRAFEGKLVPQNPSDEPAESLLERIRAERRAQGRLL